jgi:hypothetical protein
MSRNQRLTLVAAFVVVAVVGFVIASSGGDDDKSSGNQAAQTTPRGSVGKRTRTHSAQPGPIVEKIVIKGNVVQGGVRSIKVKTGDRVRIVVSSDTPDQLHLHGYDVEKEAKPGAPARFGFKADLEGVFELESHTAEHAGLEPAVAKLVVEPS